MGPKRHLGLHQATKKKKLEGKDQQGNAEEEKPSNELRVELSNDADGDNEIEQLKGLWKTYLFSEKENELILNGIVNESDRLLRDSSNSEKETPEMPEIFHSIYGLALGELALFQGRKVEKVKEFFQAAFERIQVGLDVSPKSPELLFAKARLLIRQIPLQYVAQLNEESTISDEIPDLSKNADYAFEVFDSAQKEAEEQAKMELFDSERFEILRSVEDLLQLIKTFGKIEDDTSSDGEDESDDDEVELSPKHPLYLLRYSEKYYNWWKNNVVLFLKKLDVLLAKFHLDYTDEEKSEHELISLRREICKEIGQALLQEAELPSSVHSTLAYDDDFKDVEELEGFTQEESQKLSQKLYTETLEYLKQAQNKDDPQSWVSVAEATISLGNLFPLESSEQEEQYQKAEKIIVRANNVTNGKYQNILDTLQEK